MMSKVDFKSSNYFPGYIYYSGFIFIALGLVVLITNPILGVILCLPGLIFVTTHYRLSLDQVNKVYHDYVWVLGFRIGDKGAFNSIEYLFLKKSYVSQTMHLRVASSTIYKEVYDGYLKFSENNKLHLFTLDSKENLIGRLRRIAGQLKTKIVDYSEGQPIEI